MGEGPGGPGEDGRSRGIPAMRDCIEDIGESSLGFLTADRKRPEKSHKTVSTLLLTLSFTSCGRFEKAAAGGFVLLFFFPVACQVFRQNPSWTDIFAGSPPEKKKSKYQWQTFCSIGI